MSEELQMQPQAVGQETGFQKEYYLKEAAALQNPAEQLKKSLEELEDYGGYDLIESLVDGLENMNPESRAAKKIFLQESEFKDQREKMKIELAMWLDVLADDLTTASEAVGKCQEEAQKIKQNLNENLVRVHDSVKKLEIAYRALGSFFVNTGQNKVQCLSLMNVDKEDLADPESKAFKAIRDELNNHFDRLSLKENYSLLVSPGYLGDKQAVNLWGQMAYRNKVMLVTDYQDAPNLKLLTKGLDKASLSDSDVYLANVIMACNYILGRKKTNADDEEEEDLFIPPSAAIAGKMYDTEGITISQGVAGKKYGTIDNARGTRLDLLKSELTTLIDKGVVPMVFEENRVMAFSNKSLYNGATIGLQEYPIVRVFDWIGKVFTNFFNDEAFKNWNSQLATELRQQVIDFLEDYKGPGKLIEGYSNPKITRDEKTKDIHIEIQLKPFFAAKNFYIKLTGHNGDNGITEWSNEIS